MLALTMVAARWKCRNLLESASFFHNLFYISREAHAQVNENLEKTLTWQGKLYYLKNCVT